MTALKTIDPKGRLTLGRQYAGRQAKVEERNGDVVVTFHKLVPDREAWLYENSAAAEMVRQGLTEAARGELSDGPDLEAAFAFADSISDDE